MKGETLIIGSSPFALGYGKNHKDYKIFESKFLLDSVFCGTLNGYKVFDKNSEYSRIFENADKVKNGIRDLECSEVLLSEFALFNKINLFFNREIISIKKSNNFSVTYFDNTGINEEEFERIIDCRTKTSNRFFNIVAKSEQEPKGDFLVLEKISEQYYLLQFDLKKDMNCAEAKPYVFNIIKKCFTNNEKWATSGVRTYSNNYMPPFVDENNIIHIAPMYYKTPEEAFEQGVHYE